MKQISIVEKLSTKSHDIIRKYYKEDKIRYHFCAHHMYFLRLSALKKINEMFPKDFDFTMKHRLRHGDDTALPFLHSNYLVKEGLGERYFEHPQLFMFSSFSNKKSENENRFKIMKEKKHPFVLLNDEIKTSSRNVMDIIQQFNNNMQQIYPVQTPFENADN